MKNLMKSHLSLIVLMLGLLFLLLFPMAALAQTEKPDSHLTEDVQGPILVETVVATAVVPAPEQPDTPAPPIDTAVAGFISSLPAMFAFAALLGLVIYLIRDRKQITAMLATAIPADMAASIVDTAIKGVFSALGTMNRMMPGDIDDKVVDRLATDAGLLRVPAADGKGFTWQPVKTELASPGTNPDRPYAGMERITLGDGSFAYKPAGAHTGVSRAFNEDGSYTLDAIG